MLADRNSSIVTKVGEIVSRYSLAGAVLWDALDEVRDWEGMARYLLFDHSASRANGEADPEDIEKAVKSLVALDPKVEIILLQVLNASVTGSIIKGPEPSHKRKPGQTVCSSLRMIYYDAPTDQLCSEPSRRSKNTRKMSLAVS